MTRPIIPAATRHAAKRCSCTIFSQRAALGAGMYKYPRDYGDAPGYGTCAYTVNSLKPYPMASLTSVNMMMALGSYS